MCLINDVEIPCDFSYSWTNRLKYIYIYPVTPLSAGLKNIVIGVKHPFDDKITGLRWLGSTTIPYSYHENYYIYTRAEGIY